MSSRTFRSGTALTGAAVGAAAVATLGVRDLLQRQHSILRIYPIVGHAR